jgi:hypothetical protein
MKRTKKIILLLCCILPLGAVWAQDTSQKTIEITSSFKPVLRNAAKINFNATPPVADTNRPRLQYNVPAQNVFPRLSPVAISPLSLPADSSGKWANNNYVKAGYGNLQTPYIEAGLSIPAGNSRVDLMLDHISSNGKIENQNYAESGVKGYFFTPLNKDVEFHASAGFSQDKYYQYGYDRTKYNFDKEDLLQRFSTFAVEAGVRNPVATEFGLTYHPRLNISVFNDNRKNGETNAVLNVPIEKFVGNSFGIKLGLVADMTRYTPSGMDAVNNNLFTVPVALTVRTPNLKVNAGIVPSWDNGAFKLLPNILVDFPIAGEKWIIQAGWLSYFNKGNYQRFASINPYLAAPVELKNNRMIERYVGFKGTILNHFSYSAKAGYAEFRRVPLFVNDTASGKSFNIIFEEELKAMQFQGEFGIVQAEKFSLAAKFNYYKYNDQETEDRAWGLIPLELSANLRWQVMKDLWLTSDFFIWDGALYTNKKGNEGRSPGAIDLNAGLEFRVLKNIFLWTQFNNIFNSSYQRWNQYDNYGFNMLIGGIYRFNQ